MTTPKPDAATPRPYYAKDGVVWARPTTTPNSDGSVSMTMGFCVCEICSHVTDNAAEEIATALNNAGDLAVIHAGLEYSPFSVACDRLTILP